MIELSEPTTVNTPTIEIVHIDAAPPDGLDISTDNNTVDTTTKTNTTDLPTETTENNTKQSKKRKHNDNDDVPVFEDYQTTSRSGRTITVTADQQLKQYLDEQRKNKRKQAKLQQQQQADNDTTDDSRWGTCYNCAVCEGTGDLLPCIGGCRNLFHTHCITNNDTLNNDDYTCVDCINNTHMCYAPDCNTEGIGGIEVFKCSKDNCGKYYHLSCIQELSHVKYISDKQKHKHTNNNDNHNDISHVFICPQHFCDACDGPETKSQPVIRCIRCPTAYHYNYNNKKIEHKNLCIPEDIYSTDIFEGGYCLCKKLNGVDHALKPSTNVHSEDILHAKELSKPVVWIPNSVYFNDVQWEPPGWYMELQIPKSLVLEVDAMLNKRTTTTNDTTKSNKMQPPPPYRKIAQNDWRYVGGKPIMRTDEIEICSCVYDPATEQVCDSNCELRAMHMECTRWCKSGDQCQNQRLRNKQYAGFKLFHTTDRGYGLISTEHIPPNTLITEYCGEIIDEDECHTRLAATIATGNKNFYMMKLSKSLIIDAQPAGNYARFINHSCAPNCHTEQWTVNGSTRIGIYSSMDIPVGTELTYDYLCDTFGEIASEPCCCGAANCSGTLGGKKVDTKTVKTKAKRKKVRKPVVKQQPQSSDTESDIHEITSDQHNDNNVQIEIVDEIDTLPNLSNMMTGEQLDALTVKQSVDTVSINSSVTNDSDIENVSTNMQSNGYVKQQVQLIEQRTVVNI